MSQYQGKCRTKTVHRTGDVYIVIIGKLQPIVVWRNFDVVAAQVAITLLPTIRL